MAEAVAFTYCDDDRELPPRKVEGELKKRYVESLGYEQVFVGGELVDPATVVEAD